MERRPYEQDRRVKHIVADAAWRRAARARARAHGAAAGGDRALGAGRPARCATCSGAPPPARRASASGRLRALRFIDLLAAPPWGSAIVSRRHRRPPSSGVRLSSSARNNNPRRPRLARDRRLRARVRRDPGAVAHLRGDHDRDGQALRRVGRRGWLARRDIPALVRGAGDPGGDRCSIAGSARRWRRAARLVALGGLVRLGGRRSPGRWPGRRWSPSPSRSS